ncbi:MAG: tetratricopeptide repeat protein [Gemmatimonadales bacterium]
MRWQLALGTAVVAITGRAASAQSDSVEATSLLGKPLIRPTMSPTARAEAETNLAAARRAFDRTPTNADSIIWLGRRTAYLGRFREAIAIYTTGIGQHPSDARFYRHRGHRYLSIRRLDDAVRDFQRADALTKGRPDGVEPDGQPNARGIPTSTLQSNIRYHLGLAHYLKGDFAKALPFYQRDVEAAVNPDMVVASSHWLYMTLRRLGRDREAAKVLVPISKDMEIIENGSYHRLLLMYQGELSPDAVLTPADRGDAIQDATVAYGVGNWHLYNGRRGEARAVFERIMGMPQWGAFGYIAAEAELARMR